jgi:hypothetical protein
MSPVLKDSDSDHVVADINYFPALGMPIPTSAWKTPYLGISNEFTRPMTIHDVRKSDQTFSLDINGFQFIKLPSRHRVSAADDEEIIKREYYPELEQIAKEL